MQRLNLKFNDYAFDALRNVAKDDLWIVYKKMERLAAYKLRQLYCENACVHHKPAKSVEVIPRKMFNFLIINASTIGKN